MKQLELSTQVTRNSALVTSCLDDELVMMDAEEGRYFSLNATTSRIWEMLAKPKRVSDVCDDLMTLYNVDRERCEAQVLKVVSDMHRQGLVLVQT
jgi:Coenzyme PQQ synthesis protein D (PqqD)